MSNYKTKLIRHLDNQNMYSIMYSIESSTPAENKTLENEIKEIVTYDVFYMKGFLGAHGESILR